MVKASPSSKRRVAPGKASASSSSTDADASASGLVEIRGYELLAGRNRVITRFAKESLKHQSSDLPPTAAPADDKIKATTTVKSSAKAKGEQAKQRQRKQSRVSQRRHRDREASKVYNLTLDVNQLKQKIADLENRKNLLLRSHCMPKRPSESIQQMVEFFYELFRFGMRAPSPSSSPSSSSCLAAQQANWPQMQLYQRQVDFSKWFHAEKFLRGDRVIDVDAMVDHWNGIAVRHPGFDVRIEQCDVVEHTPRRHRGKGKNKAPSGVSDTFTGAIARVSIVWTSRITRTTLLKVFPHIAHNDKLQKMLLGKELQVFGTMLYYFNAQRKVVCNIIDQDFFGAINQLVQKAESALVITENMSVTTNQLLSDQGEYVHAPPTSTVASPMPLSTATTAIDPVTSTSSLTSTTSEPTPMPLGDEEVKDDEPSRDPLSLSFILSSEEKT